MKGYKSNVDLRTEQHLFNIAALMSEKTRFRERVGFLVFCQEGGQDGFRSAPSFLQNFDLHS